MFAHEVINQINKYLCFTTQINHEFRNELKIIVQLLYGAAKYHMGTYLDVFNNSMLPRRMEYKNRTGRDMIPFSVPELTAYAKLPYPTTWIDFFTGASGGNVKYRRGILLNIQFDVLYIHSFSTLNNNWAVNPCVGMILLSEEDVMKKIIIKQTPCFGRPDELKTLYDEMNVEMNDMITTAYHFLLYLNDRNVQTVDNHPSRLLERIINKNKCPKFVYKTLVITNAIVKYENKKQGTYVVKGVMPEHEVAGHPRRLRSGKIATVKAHKRGRIENGKVVKEYVFVNGVRRKRAKKIMKGGV
jgi:hypothetical protein